MLIIVYGLPGSGKTTLARALASRYNAVYLSSDSIRKQLFGKPEYTEEEKEIVYADMEARAIQAIKGGRDTVVDATFYKRALRERFLDAARSVGARAFIVLCSLGEGEIQERLGSRRKGGPSDADFSIYLKMKESFEAVAENHIEIDSALPLSERLRRVDAYIGDEGG